MTIPAWSGFAVSPLWGIGDALSLDIAAGADWSVPFKAFAADGVTPLDVTDPVLEMRRDRTSASQLLAHFDTTGSAPGLITVVDTGSWMLSMDAADTSALPTGRGFWDCFGQVNGHPTAIASGIVVVRPKVTASTVPWTPSAPPPPPITVDTTPQVIDLAFAAGDDFHLAIALTDTDDGDPADLSQATVDAAVTTSTGTVLAPFGSSINANTLTLTLPAPVTTGLPAGARWYLKVSTPADGTETVAAGSVTVVR